MQLDLSCNRISELKGLGNKQFLVEINLMSNKIRVVKGLKGLRYLDELDLLGNPIESIESIDELKGISRLSINISKIPEEEIILFRKHFWDHGHHSYVSRKSVNLDEDFPFNPVRKSF